MENIEAKELHKGHTRGTFEVILTDSRYDELRMIAADHGISEAQALERVIREGFDS